MHSPDLFGLFLRESPLEIVDDLLACPFSKVQDVFGFNSVILLGPIFRQLPEHGRAVYSNAPCFLALQLFILP